MQPTITRTFSKPAPHHMAQGTAKLVVHSIGSSGISLVRSLRQVMLIGEADIAALLLQAPSTLMTGMERATADSVADLLTETGLDCAIYDESVQTDEGAGDFEVALHIRDPAQMPAVVLEIMQLLGLDAAAARKLACSVPAPLLGRVSRATVDALTRRFAPLGAQIDASASDAATFDLYLGATPGALHERLGPRLVALAGEGAQSLLTGGVLCGVTRDASQALAQELRPLGVPLRVINRDFVRYTLKLLKSGDSNELRAALQRICGMPSNIVPQVLRALPVVLQPDLLPAEAEAAAMELTRLGAEVAVVPLPTQLFALNAEPARDPGAAVALLCQLGDVEEIRAAEMMRGRKARIPGPYSAPHARWLQHELRKIGVKSTLEAL